MNHQPSLFDNKVTSTPKRSVYAVSELTSKIKALLEDKFPFIWIYGEISNFSAPRSGHFYFVLKDEQAQISAVMFGGQNRHLTFKPENGMTVTGMGRISVYEPRGAYQIILEYLEPRGIGTFQLAFEQLKKILSAEGLFDDSHKKPLPLIPSKIGVITSPTGAVIQDIIKITDRRFADIPIEITPVSVQGEKAVQEIVTAIDHFNRRADTPASPDVVILARGGGSLEDLAAFNSEAVARAIYDSSIPIVSAIGHETDYTIADFTADLRAPTPSAAAELVTPVKHELLQRIAELNNALTASIRRQIKTRRQRLDMVRQHLVSPRTKIQDLRLKTDDLTQRMTRCTANHIQRRRERFIQTLDKLYQNRLGKRIELFKITLKQSGDNLINLFKKNVESKQHRLREMTTHLNALSPIAILSRGYSITRSVEDGRVITDPDEVAVNQNVHVMIAKGKLTCRIERKYKNAEKEDL
ncbi:exodeoxyribonuclease VII large subunit [Desulfococcaceae bacterium HSG7]|nr:exodeoxyribonuclease VII large subunit [Desulfococcaceae bacterium HSG7]